MILVAIFEAAFNPGSPLWFQVFAVTLALALFATACAAINGLVDGLTRYAERLNRAARLRAIKRESAASVAAWKRRMDELFPR